MKQIQIMTSSIIVTIITLLLLQYSISSISSFIVPAPTKNYNIIQHRNVQHDVINTIITKQSSTLFSEQSPREELSVFLEPTLTEERMKSLFAWVSRAFAGDDEYNNLMFAMAAIFGTNLPPNSLPLVLVERGKEYKKHHSLQLLFSLLV